MRSLEEVIDFIRGRRARPPPGPKHPRAAALLVAASLLHLPLVFLLVSRIHDVPSVTLAVGLLAIGLAWCGGVSLEGRRPGTVRWVAALGAAEGALAFVPLVAEPLGAARWAFLAIAALSALALVAARVEEPVLRS